MFSTVVTSDVAIVTEREMPALGQGHDLAGVVEPGTKWALAEGRTGGAQKFRTYLTLSNPQPKPATVTVSYLRENGASVEQTYTVPAMSRVEVDATTVPGLQAASFGALINVTNNVPIVVERAMFWESPAAASPRGTSTMATRLP